jgi:hypothetical protein
MSRRANYMSTGSCCYKNSTKSCLMVSYPYLLVLSVVCPAVVIYSAVCNRSTLYLHVQRVEIWLLLAGNFGCY